ncbi:MAG: molybdenum ABC transporter ATP-binding protein [Rhodocyclaceae bacterium]|nr:molybdenum ABC transporter ATP-binding protein [Rhodocyclaceae bacterium]
MSIEARFKLDYPAFTLDVNLNLPDAGITALFGPSGSGKTTLLRAIAGLERVAGGRLVVDGHVWQHDSVFLPVHQRPLGYVFQEASLFPHLSVRGNIDYGRRRSGHALDDGALNRIVDLLGIGTLLSRRPAGLSGGERQRVALARALAVGPRLLLMDEPLAALDFQRKREALPYLERLRAELKIPIFYVSHAPDEVARLADHLVVLEAGRVQAQGPLKQVLADVATPIRLGEDAGSVIDGTVAERDAHWQLARVEFPGGGFWVRDEGHEIGRRVRLRVLARDVSIALREECRATSVLNHLSVRVEAIAGDLHPALTLVRLAAEGQSLVARVTRRSAEALALEPGKQVWAQIKAVAVIG